MLLNSIITFKLFRCNTCLKAGVDGRPRHNPGVRSKTPLKRYSVFLSYESIMCKTAIEHPRVPFSNASLGDSDQRATGSHHFSENSRLIHTACVFSFDYLGYVRKQSSRVLSSPSNTWSSYERKRGGECFRTQRKTRELWAFPKQPLAREISMPVSSATTLI